MVCADCRDDIRYASERWPQLIPDRATALSTSNATCIQQSIRVQWKTTRKLTGDNVAIATMRMMTLITGRPFSNWPVTPFRPPFRLSCRFIITTMATWTAITCTLIHIKWRRPFRGENRPDPEEDRVILLLRRRRRRLIITAISDRLPRPSRTCPKISQSRNLRNLWSVWFYWKMVFDGYLIEICNITGDG